MNGDEETFLDFGDVRTMTLDEEVRQVAAVGAAWYERLTFGTADYDRPTEGGGFQGTTVSVGVREERRNQDQKFGPQDHPSEVWLAILLEEVGEVAELIELTPAQDEGTLGTVVALARSLGNVAKSFLEDELAADL